MSKQTSLWIRDQYLNLYSHSEISKDSASHISKKSAQLFLKKITRAEYVDAKAELMMQYLVDPDDEKLLHSLSDVEIENCFISWIVDAEKV